MIHGPANHVFERSHIAEQFGLKPFLGVSIAFLCISLLGCSDRQPEVDNHCAAANAIDLGWTSEKLVFLGEYHGSNEAPRLFLQAVCDGLRRNGNNGVGVALELPKRFNEQYFLKIGKDRAEHLVGQVAADDFWTEFGDGRHSAAMLELVTRLIELSAATPGSIRIIAFEQPELDVSAVKDLLDLANARDVSTVFVLTGNAHARLTPIPGFEGNHLAGNSAGQGVSVWSVNIMPASGDAWICAPECAVREIPVSGPIPSQPQLTPGSGLGDGAYSATLRIPELTLSPPVE